MAPKRNLFHRSRKRSNPAVILILLLCVVAVLLFNQALARGDVRPVNEPTPTATRLANSYVLEAQTHFDAGSLAASVAAFEQAIAADPNNGALYAELARVVVYASEMVTTDEERKERLELAVEYTRQAVELAPESSQAFAVRAFALDWYATYVMYTLLDAQQGEQLLADAEQAISRALVLDETNVHAQIYYAEILVDRMRFEQAESALRKALDLAPNLWEAHRVNGLFLENQGRYEDAIEAFKEAVRLAPNMTFLYIKLGQSYRQLALRSTMNPQENPNFPIALEYFAKAVSLNEQLGIEDPYPYLGIGYTYAQLGEFFVASRNMERALTINPNSPRVYGDLGMVARQGSNYEMAIDALGCAVRGCTAEVSCIVRQCNDEIDPQITVTGMALNANTVTYYFTYASLLAGMHIPGHKVRSKYCPEAIEVINEILAVPNFANEPIITSILDEGTAICASYGYK